MSSRKVIRWIAIALGCFVGTLFLVVSPAYAAGTTLQLSPASSTIAPNSTFAVAVRINTGTESINAVQANFSYPSSKVEFVSISATGSSFEIGAPSSGGDGNISIARAQLGGVSSNDALVATVTFRVITGSGSVTMAFTDGSEALSNRDSRDVLTGTSGGTYTIGSGSGGVTPSGNPPSVVPDPAGNPAPPSASSSFEQQSPGAGSATPLPDSSKLTTELKNDVGGATTAKVFGQPVGSKTAVWGIAGLILAAAFAVGAMVYFRHRHASAASVGSSRPGHGGYAQPVVVSSPPTHYVTTVAPVYPIGQTGPISRPNTASPTGPISVYAPANPTQTIYPQRQMPPQGQPYQNLTGQNQTGQMQPVIVRPTLTQPVPPGLITGQPQQNFNPVGWSNNP